MFSKATVLLALLAADLSAQTVSYWLKPADYNPAIPTQNAILGHAPGDRISSPAEILRYMEAMAAAAPSRMKIFTYGETWEHRKLIYAVIGSEANMARLTEIEADMSRLADPRRTSAAQAAQLNSRLPALVWLAYGVHGNEISSPDAALLTTYHLLATRNDKLVDQILKDDLIFIDPLENPDGRERFVHHFESVESMTPDPDQLSVEHNEAWPGGRTNHYYFDMNRDWFAMTQPETRGRIAAVRRWMPHVFVDLHEMSSDSTYYFAPEANPYNPFITAQQKASLEWFGKNNARYFDQLGFPYFTKEGYDEFYPGYGASWPLYYGSIGMTYEQASTRGLVVRRSDGSLFTYADTVRKHFVTSLSTLETASRHREALLNNFYAYRTEALNEGRNCDTAEYVLVREGNTSAVDTLAAHLADQGVEVKRAAAAFRNGDRTYPAGSYVIPFAQPSYRLLRALLDPQISMDPTFLAAEEHRRQSRQPSEMYDVTAWSLPLQYGVQMVSLSRPSAGDFIPVPANFVVPGSVQGPAKPVAYLIPWGTTAAGRFLAAALQQDLRIASADRSFVLNARAYPAGTLIMQTSENPADLPARIAALAATTGAEVSATDSGWTDEGPNFGSRHNVYIPSRLRIALAWDRPTAASAAGAARFVLERQFGYPVTIVRPQQLALGDLSSFKVILLPDTASETYDGIFGAAGVRRLHEWVENGGTLVALGPGATAFLSHSGLLATFPESSAETEDKPRPKAPATHTEAEPGESAGHVPGKILSSEADFQAETRPASETPDPLHGVLLRAKVDPTSWLSAGVAEEVNVMVTGRAIFTPLKSDHGVNAAYFQPSASILASGFMWEPNRKQLAFKPFVALGHQGRGNVIAFTADPNFRGYMDGLNVLFLNAIFRGPAHTRPNLVTTE